MRLTNFFEVLLQAMKTDVPPDMKCKDKFLLQSTKITDEPEDANLNDLVLRALSNYNSS